MNFRPFLLLLSLIVGGCSEGPAGALSQTTPDCESEEALATLTQAFNESQFARQLSLSAVEVTDAKSTAASSAKSRTCTAVIAMNNTESVAVRYTIVPRDYGYMVEFEVTNTAESAGEAAVAAIDAAVAAANAAAAVADETSAHNPAIDCDAMYRNASRETYDAKGEAYFREHCPGHELPLAWQQSVPVEDRGARTGAAPSFNCEAAASRVENMICVDERLADLDVEMADAYSKARETVADRGALQTDQNQWRERVRDRCTDSLCLTREYIRRTDVLNSLASEGVASPTVGETIESPADMEPTEDIAGRALNPPRYPPAALRACAHGVVRLRVSIDAAGNVSAVDIDESSGNDSLDVAAQQAAHRWRFNPGRRNGQPVGGDIVVPVNFHDPC